MKTKYSQATPDSNKLYNNHVDNRYLLFEMVSNPAGRFVKLFRKLTSESAKKMPKRNNCKR